MHPRVHRSDRDAEGFGHGLGREVEVVPKHEHRALVEGQSTEGVLQLVSVEYRSDLVGARYVIEVRYQ